MGLGIFSRFVVKQLFLLIEFIGEWLGTGSKQQHIVMSTLVLRRSSKTWDSSLCISAYKYFNIWIVLMSVTQRLHYFLKVKVKYSLYLCKACSRSAPSDACQSTLVLVHCLLSFAAQVLHWWVQTLERQICCQILLITWAFSPQNQSNGRKDDFEPDLWVSDACNTSRCSSMLGRKKCPSRFPPSPSLTIA